MIRTHRHTDTHTHTHTHTHIDAFAWVLWSNHLSFPVILHLPFVFAPYPPFTSFLLFLPSARVLFSSSSPSYSIVLLPLSLVFLFFPLFSLHTLSPFLFLLILSFFLFLNLRCLYSFPSFLSGLYSFDLFFPFLLILSIYSFLSFPSQLVFLFLTYFFFFSLSFPLISFSL